MIDSIASYNSFHITSALFNSNLRLAPLASQEAAPVSAVRRDSYSFSDEARELGRQGGMEETSRLETLTADEARNQPSLLELTPAEEQQVDHLRQRDREVRAHEQTHKSMLGGYAAGGPYYEYQTGPDNRRYAVGGSVDVDTSKENSPEKTIQKAQTIKRAAMAVKDPSGADKSVASQAAQMEQEARAELAKKQQEMQQAIAAYGMAGQQAASLLDKVV